MKAAPFHSDMAEGPKGGKAFWLNTADGVKVRAGYWPGGDKGTVLLFPGRTEYIEKYGRAATDLAKRGYATLTIDWRGQGLADRLDENPISGHVGKFSDYQLDVEAMLELAEFLNCPKPYYLMAHSMGGCIGLRSLHEKMPVKAAVFSAPMWGISIAPRLRPFAWALSWATHQTKLGLILAPGTKPVSYVLTEPHEDNVLTSDPDMFDYMKRHVSEVEELILGGPTLQWLFEALVETRRLRAMKPPETPAITFLGSNERVVDVRPVHVVMNKWQNGRLEFVEGAEHEVLMEKLPIRTAFFDEADALFSKHS